LFGTSLSLDIRKLELYDLYTIQSEHNHRIIEQSEYNNTKYNQINENKPYHPLLDIQSEGLSDSESNDDNLNNKSRKIRWNWTIVFIVLSILIFGSNINQEDEEIDTYYYSENYNITYALNQYEKYYSNDYPDIITSLSHILPKYWVHFKNNYNEKINVEDLALSSLGINYYVVINSLVHISVEDEFLKLYEPETKIMGLNMNNSHPFIINIIISFNLLLCLIACMILNSSFYYLYTRILEYSKKIKSSLSHIIFYFFPFFDYEKYFGKKFIIPLYQPTYLVKVNKDKLEKYQSKNNYELAISSTMDIHIINGSEYESIDYILIKNPDQKVISSHYQQDYFNTEDEKAIILWGGRHSSINLWSSEPLIKKSKAKAKNKNSNKITTGIYYYRNPYIAKKKYLEKDNKDDLYHFINNYSIYINKPTFKCQMNSTQNNIYDLSMDVYNDYILMASKTLFYQWEFYNKTITYFDILKDNEDEILWILNSNERFSDIKKQVINPYLHNQQFYDSELYSQMVNGDEPYFIVVITKAGKILTLDSEKNLINTIALKETLARDPYLYHQNKMIMMNDSSSQTQNSYLNSNTTLFNYNKNNINNINKINNNDNHRSNIHPLSQQNNTLSTMYNTNELASTSSSTYTTTQSSILKSPSIQDKIPACYHYDTLNRLWISLKNKIIVCYQLPTLQPLFILNENNMHFMVLSSQAQNEININKNNSFYTESNTNKYWSSRHYKGHQQIDSDEDQYYINEKLFISREYSKMMISNEDVGWLVTSDATGYMTVWNIKEGKVWDNVKCPSPITNIFIIKSSSKVSHWWIVSSHEDETVRLWDTKAGILSCSEVWYQPGCSTIACHNGVIVGARRVCIREKSAIENFILKIFLDIVLIVNFFVNVFIHHNNNDILNSIEMIYQNLKEIHFSRRSNPLMNTLYTIRDILIDCFHFRISLSVN
jgi:hypothetical protein